VTTWPVGAETGSRDTNNLRTAANRHLHTEIAK
jgi:hypothetical protein